MYKIIKSTSAHLGLVFVFISIAVAPASLKVSGLGSILSGAAQTWRQVANVFGANYQPVDAVELSALNGDSKLAPAGEAQSACEQTLIASLNEKDDSQIDNDVAARHFETTVAAKSEPAGCDKENGKPARMKKRVESVALPASLLSAASNKVKSFELISTGEGGVVVKVVGKQLAEQKVELRETLKAVQILKYGDLDFKLKLPVLTAPKATPCKQRPVPTPERREALRLRAAAMSLADVPAWGPENSEF
ncbi:MAG TPA: hypothetical protein VIG62_05315 [Blastocatellia bacterium]|jgi:hypothetical protein